MIQCKLLPFESTQVKLTDEKGSFAGYASVFGGNDSYGDTILKGAYAKTLANRKRLPWMLFNHVGSAKEPKSDLPTQIGLWTKMVEDEKGLWVEGKITYGHPVGSAVIASMRNGAIDGLSIGYRVSSEDYEPKPEGGRVISNMDLVEVSVVENPADYEARISLDTVKSQIEEVKTIRDAERLLREAAGLSRDSARFLIAKIKSVVLSESEAKEAKGVLEEISLMLAETKIPQSLRGNGN